MVAVIQVELALQTHDARELVGLPFVAEHVVADGAGLADVVAHIVIGRADHVTGVTLLEELGDRSAAENWDVVGVRLDSCQNFALVRRPRERTLEGDAGRLALELEDGARRYDLTDEFTPLHVGILYVIWGEGKWLEMRLKCAGQFSRVY